MYLLTNKDCSIPTCLYYTLKLSTPLNIKSLTVRLIFGSHTNTYYFVQYSIGYATAPYLKFSMQHSCKCTNSAPLSCTTYNSCYCRVVISSLQT